MPLRFARAGEFQPRRRPPLRRRRAVSGMVCRRCHPGVTDQGKEAGNLRIAIYNMRQGDGIRYETPFLDATWELWMLPIAVRNAHAAAGQGPGRVPPGNLHPPYVTRLGLGGYFQSVPEC
jgi:hypothetical protein